MLMRVCDKLSISFLTLIKVMYVAVHYPKNNSAILGQLFFWLLKILFIFQRQLAMAEL